MNKHSLSKMLNNKCKSRLVLYSTLTHYKTHSPTPEGEVRSFKEAYQHTVARPSEGVTPIVKCTVLAIGKESPHFNIATHAETRADLKARSTEVHRTARSFGHLVVCIAENASILRLPNVQLTHEQARTLSQPLRTEIVAH